MSGQASGKKFLLLSGTLSPPGVRMGSRGKEQRAGIGLPRTGGLSRLGWKPTAPGCGGWPTGSGRESLLLVYTNWMGPFLGYPANRSKQRSPPPQVGTGRFLALFSEGRGSQCLEKELLKGERVRKDQNPQGPHLTPRMRPPPTPGRSPHSCLPVECSHDAEA